MATQYKDIGSLGAQSAPLVPVDTKRYNQVYQATHKDGERLPYMNRSFISFTYGDKHIEDFNLIAYTDGDRMQRDAYASFEDLTLTYDVLPGQFYWGTYYHNNSLSLSLATDGISQRDLDDFRYWFRAGSCRELILSEHPNRAIMARIAQPPVLKLLPFESKVSVPFTIGENETASTVEYETSTTLYRGEIELEFVMDEPFWYAKQNLLGLQDTTEGYYAEKWIDANGKSTTIKESKDALKIIYEDHIPLGSTTRVNVFLGGDIYATVEYKLWSLIVKEISQEDYNTAQEKITDGALDAVYAYAYESYASKYYEGAMIATEDEQGNFIGGGRISGASLSNSSKVDGVFLPVGKSANLYYAGNAPSPVTLRFVLSPKFAQDFYIVSPYNRYTSGTKYNTITLHATMEHKFQFTVPAIWLNYNHVLEIFDSNNIVREGNAWLTVRETIRDTIRHPVIRAWANRMIDYYEKQDDSGIIHGSIDTIRGGLKGGMQLLFTDNDENGFPATFIFNGKTGEATGVFIYRNVRALDGIEFNTSSSLAEQIRTAMPVASTEYSISINLIQAEENVGDMVKSNYLILDERNVLDDKFQVQAWTESHPDYAYMVTHDVSGGLEKVHFEFQNLYL